MEHIYIICHECGFFGNPDYNYVDLNYNDLKKIINSNYATNVIYCYHKINEVDNFRIKIHCITHMKKLAFRVLFINTNYILIYNRFIVDINNETISITLDNGCNLRDASIEEFKSLIKKGTIILCTHVSATPILQKILLEHNIDFILKEAKEFNYITHIIDAPNYTKPASVIRL